VGIQRSDCEIGLEADVSVLISDSLYPLSYCNLVVEHAEVLAKPCLLLILLYALGGSIPSAILESMHLPQRRWDTQGEIYHTDAAAFGIPPEFIRLLTDSHGIAEAFIACGAAKHITDDGGLTWSLSDKTMQTLGNRLLPSTKDYLRTLALSVLCFVVPPCFEGNLDW
jgi:hypothetical protein